MNIYKNQIFRLLYYYDLIFLIVGRFSTVSALEIFKIFSHFSIKITINILILIINMKLKKENFRKFKKKKRI